MDIRIDPGTDYRVAFSVATRTDSGDDPWELVDGDVTMTIQAGAWAGMRTPTWTVPLSVSLGSVAVHMDPAFTSQFSDNWTYYYVVDVRGPSGDISRVMQGNVLISKGRPRG